MKNGTPKTLNEAIQNALHQTARPSDLTFEERAIVIEVNVKDFLAQKFGLHTISTNENIAESINQLWAQVTRKE